MSLTWTMTRLVRWRVRDWASCFMASRFYMDEDSDWYCSSKQTKFAVRNMGFDPNGDHGVKRRKKMRRERKCRRERKLKNTPLPTKDEAFPAEYGDGDLNYPDFVEEDYIVFCFKEDGAFDVVKDGKPEPANSIDLLSSSRKLVNRKKQLNYGEEAMEVQSCSIEDMLNGHECDIIPHHQTEEEEEDGVSVNSESVIVEGRRRSENEKQDDESSESNRSSGSFAFPILGWEWSGSPVKMPKPALHFRKHKALLRLGFHCCRF